MAKWTAVIKNHLYLADNKYTFGSIPKLKDFIEENDINCDHVIEIIRTSIMEPYKTSFTLVDIKPVTTIKLILVEKGEKLLGVDYA